MDIAHWPETVGAGLPRLPLRVSVRDTSVTPAGHTLLTAGYTPRNPTRHTPRQAKEGGV